MKREEEIKQEVDIRLSGSSGDYSDGYEEGFIAGAKWADEHQDLNGKELLYVAQKTAERTKKEVISKAYEWLDNIDTDDYMDSGIFQMSDLIIDFKKQWNHEKKMYVL